MPLLITADIVSATKQPKSGWTLMELREFKKVQNKKRSGVIDYTWTFDCLDGPGNTSENKGRSFRAIVFGNALSSGVPEAAQLVMSLSIAITGETAEDLIGKEVPFEDLYGTKVWCEIKDEPFEGRILKKANAFTPEYVVPF